VTGWWHSLVIDCSHPRELADFYAALLGMTRLRDTPDHVEIGHEPAHPRIVFQKVADYRPPRWPRPDQPAHMHLDIVVDNLDIAQARILDLGGTLLDGSDKPIGYRVYADPAGHPFCLVTPEGLPDGPPPAPRSS
jgi:catechol 2,3-dioxygenase-like lactoylglutathione lyase family enzyme